MSDKVALVVLGCHRSGTSAITRLLNLLGARLPRNLMPPLEGVNARGFWESTEVQELNDQALASAGSAWDDVRTISPDWFESRSGERFVARAETLLEQLFGDSRLFVLKDPRLCRLIPLWDRALRARGAECRFVHIFRNPLEVAASLAKRDGFEAARSHLLWLTYALSAEQASRGRSRAFMSYEDLLQDWPAEVEKLSRALEISWPRSVEDIRIEVGRFLAPEARHHVADGGPTESEASAPVRRIYDALRQLAAHEPADTGSETTLATFDSIQAALHSADSLYGPIVTEPKNRVRLETAEVGSVAEVEQLREENRALREELSRLRQQLRSKTFELGRRDQELRSLDRRIADQTATLRSTRRSLARLVRGVRELELIEKTREPR